MPRIGKATAIAVAGAVLVGIFVVVTTGDGQQQTERGSGLVGDRPLRPTANAEPLRGKAGPNLAVDPGDENHLVELHQELATGDCEFNTSFDRGRSWTGGRLQPPAGSRPGRSGPCPTTGPAVANIGQQSLAFGSGRTVYASWASTPEPDGLGATVLLSRSDDRGATFAPGVPIPGMVGGVAPEPGFARPELVVDRRAPAPDRLYVTARDVVRDRALVVRSDDGGATWGQPVEVASSSGSSAGVVLLSMGFLALAGTAAAVGQRRQALVKAVRR